MDPELRIDLASAGGVKFAEITDIVDLSAAIKVNAYGVMKAVLRGDHPALGSLENNSHVEIYYKYDGGNWTRFFGGLFRGQERSQTKEPYFTLTAIGYQWLLKTRIIAYPAMTSNKTWFSSAKAETVMKSLVTANLTSSATTSNGRIRNGTNWPATVISVAADAAGGNSVEWFCALQNLLDTLQKLSLIAGGDFDLVKTGSNAFEFRFYAGQIGADRTGSVVFSLGRGNMGEPEYKYDRLEETTAAIVGGQGEESSREFVTRTASGFSTSNDMELFVPATDVDPGNTAGMNAAGDIALAGTAARESFSFKVLQTPSTRFGSEYFLGDLVTAVNPYTGTDFTQKIVGVTLTINRGKAPDFAIETRTP